MSVLFFIAQAFTTEVSSTYGYQEGNCGAYGKPRPCEYGAVTASGEIFDPELPTAAVFAPANLRMIPTDVWMRVDKGPCVKIRVNDKGNERFIGARAFDLTPKALELLTGNRSPSWSGRVTKCKGIKNEKTNPSDRTIDGINAPSSPL
jgi:rare lipoprotein A (peptidoglycan hydrolase)